MACGLRGLQTHAYPGKPKGGPTCLGLLEPVRRVGSVGDRPTIARW